MLTFGHFSAATLWLFLALPTLAVPKAAPSLPTPDAPIPSDTLTWEERAEEAWVEGEHEEAEAWYHRILEREPESRVALLRLALLRGWRDDFDGSLEYFDRLLELEPGDSEAAALRARVLAWDGELEQALEALGWVLEDDPGNSLALEVQAQVLFWAGETEASVSAYDRLLAAEPGGVGAFRRSRAQALLSAGRLDEARRDLEATLEEASDDVETRVTLGRLLTMGGALDEAIFHFREALQHDDSFTEAWSGLARALTWTGALEEGESAWRRAVALAPHDPLHHAGLVQNLRWQGRNHTALEEAEAAPGHLRTESPELREQIQWAEAMTAPRTRVRAVHEWDSDGHRARGVTASGVLPLAPRLELSWALESRRMRLGVLQDSRYGLNLAVTRHFEPGWRTELRAGGSTAPEQAGGARPELGAAFASPGRSPVTVDVELRYAPFDVTAALLQRDVRILESNGNLQWMPWPGWSASATGGWAEVEGTVPNRRWRVGGGVDRGGDLGLAAGITAHALGFRESPDDGYFAPSRLLQMEVPVRWRGGRGEWNLRLEGAPGLQQIQGAEWEGAARGAAAVTFTWGPGREMTFSGVGSSSGLDRVGVGDAEYRFGAVTLDLRWSF